MSIATLAVRLCTVYALRGRTIAGEKIEDSPVNPLSENIQTPTVAIYCGTGEVKACGTDIYGGDRAIGLSINLHLPNKFAIDGVAIAARGSGAEMAFDLFWRQVSSVLMNDESVWANLWRDIVTDIKSIDTMPFLIELENRTRISARDFSFDLSTISDPPPGTIDPETPWFRFIEACESEPELAPMVPVIRAMIEQPTPANPVRAALGLSMAEFTAVGLAPITTGTIAPVEEFTVNDDEAGDFVVDAETPDPGA